MEATNTKLDPRPGSGVDSLRISMDPAQWERLRNELPPQGWGPFGASCHPFNHDFRYRWFQAEVILNESAKSSARIRKKAYCGSQSRKKPGLKVKFSKGNQHFDWTLNNSVQDPSYLRQCMAYKLFARAGLASSSCDFVRVQVNDAEAELYVRVQQIDHEYARANGLVTGAEQWRRFEGTRSDVHVGWSKNFESKHKIRAADPASARLQALTELVSSEQGLTPELLEPFLDLEQWFRYWVLEGMAGAWDGYSTRQNNFYVGYRTRDQKLIWLPWGTDHFFGSSRLGLMPKSAWLPWKLHRLGWARKRFCVTARGLLGHAWLESELIQEMTVMGQIVEAELNKFEKKAFRRARDEILELIASRRAEVSNELETICQDAGDTEPEVPAPRRPKAELVGEISIQFNLPHAGKWDFAWPRSERYMVSGELDERSLSQEEADGNSDILTVSGTKAQLRWTIRDVEGNLFDVSVVLPRYVLNIGGSHEVDFSSSVHGGVFEKKTQGRRLTARLVNGTLDLEIPTPDALQGLRGRLRGELLRILVP